MGEEAPADRSHAGISLIETVVAATILAIAAGATATLLLGAGRTSISNRDRTTASTLAEQDQERLRGTPIAALAAMATATPASQSKVVGGVSYTVRSAVRWVNDVAGFTPTCTSGTEGTSDYLQITSTVTPVANTPGVASQTITALLSPKVSTVGAKGTLSVPFVDRDGNPVQGVVANASGASAGSATSNAAGCSVFAYYPAGDYTITYRRDGYVTPAGDAGTQTTSGTVSTGETNFTDPQRLDRAAAVTVSVVTQPSSTSTATSTGSVPSARLANSGIDSGALTQTGSDRQSRFQFANVFPFSDGYAAFAGDCGAADPTKYGVAATRVSTDPAGSSAVAVFAPTLTVSSAVALRRLTVTAADSGCSTRYVFTSGTGMASVTMQVPFGSYDVCGNGLLSRATRTGVRMTAKAPNTLSLGLTEFGLGTCA